MGDDLGTSMLGMGIVAFVLFVFLLAYVPLVFYLLNLQRCFNAIRPEFRAMQGGLVWLALVPLLGFFMLIVAVILLSGSLKKEGEARQTQVFGDGGFAVGLAASILGLLSAIPLLGIFCFIASLVCWIVHWVKVAGFRRALADIPAVSSPLPDAKPRPQEAPPVPREPESSVLQTQMSHAAPPPPPPAEDATLRFVDACNARLTCTAGAFQGRDFPVGNGVVVGRSREADISIPDAQISNRHAWIGPMQGRLVLRDLQSTNGTYLNENLAAPIQETELRDSDIIVLGKHNQMKFRVSLG